MGFLSPTFLLTALVVAVPLVLHLLHRQRLKEVVFPALQYLKRTERDHSRRIKLRQLILMLLRVAAILLLALAGARPFLTGSGSAHPPTALAIVLDNSLSTGVILDDERALDRMKRAALQSLARATDQDRVWVLRAGEPWDVASPGGPDAARSRVEATEVSDGRADVMTTVGRALALVSSADLPVREVHVITDLQASGFPDSVRIEAGLEAPVLIWSPPWDAPPNGTVSDLQIGGGLPPVTGQRTEVAATLAGPEGSTDTVSVRLWLDEEVRGATAAPPGSSVLFPIPLAEGRRLAGYVERDPDALRGDDRRYFSVPVQDAPRVGLAGPVPPFLEEALSVLEESGRAARAAGAGAADVMISISGDGLGAAGNAGAWIVFPPADPDVLPALNSRLASARVPWRYERAADEGERPVELSSLPHVSDEIRVRRHYRLVPAAGAGAAGSEATPSGVEATLEGGEAWVVSGRTERARYLLHASPLDPGWTNLPVSSSMVPVLEWMVTHWASALASTFTLDVGDTWTVPDSVTAVADPDGTLVPLAEDRQFRVARAGLYRLLTEAEPFGTVAVNAPAAESDMSRVERDALEARSDLNAELVSAGDWSDEVFRARTGPEIWRPLLIALIAILLAESWIAASGQTEEEPITGAAPRPA